MTQVTEMLIEAKKLIDSPEKWIKGDYEKNGCYCASGAILKVCVTDQYIGVWCILDKEAYKKGFTSIPAFNDCDNTTHDDVMDLFDKAIERSMV